MSTNPLSIGLNYATAFNHLEKSCRLAAEAGFTHLMWDGHFDDDFLYDAGEMKAIHGLLKQFSLSLLDVHASAGIEKSWSSPLEYERAAGIELIKNRIRLFQELQGEGCVMIHFPAIFPYHSVKEKETIPMKAQQAFRSLDELVPWLQKEGVRLALENLPRDISPYLGQALDQYPAETIGLCFDSGHAHIFGNQLPFIRKYAERIIALHLHDNNGQQDQHLPPFMGTLDWKEVMDILHHSHYSGPLSFEVSMRHASRFHCGDEAFMECVRGHLLEPEENQRQFLLATRKSGEQVQRMLLDSK